MRYSHIQWHSFHPDILLCSLPIIQNKMNSFIKGILSADRLSPLYILFEEFKIANVETDVHVINNIISIVSFKRCYCFICKNRCRDVIDNILFGVMTLFNHFDSFSSVMVCILVPSVEDHWIDPRSNRRL